MSAATVVAQPGTESVTMRSIQHPNPSNQFHDTLRSVLDLCSSEFSPRIVEAIGEAEKQLVRLADKATIYQQNAYFDSIAIIARERAGVLPRFLDSLDNALSRLGGELAAQPFGDGFAAKQPLSLAEGAQLDESMVLADMAIKIELRVREPLYALGRRFGVIAGSARLPVEILPLGPRCITAALRDATCRVDVPLEHRMVLYRCFERVLMIRLDGFYAALNCLLAEHGILRYLHTLPTTHARADGAVVSMPASTTVPAQRTTHEAAAPAQRNDFEALRTRLNECRSAETREADTDAVQSAMAALQPRYPSRGEDATLRIRSSAQIKSDIINILCEGSSSGMMFSLRDEDSDTIDLVAMLFDFLAQQTRADGMTQFVLARLQIPMLRSALKDKKIFGGEQHPGWKLLRLLVEAARLWIDDLASGADPALVDTLRHVTEQVAFECEAPVFAAAFAELSQCLEQVGKRAVVAERRQVDAASGRDKLECARQLAAAEIGRRIKHLRPGEFLRTLLDRAWTDILTLTLLRDGEHSPSYLRRLALVDKLLSAPKDSLSSLDPGERDEFDLGLSQIGLHADDIRAIGQRLLGLAVDGNPMSQTELAIKLKGKPRVGVVQGAPESVPPEEDETPLDARVQAAFDQLHAVPHGTWFEFDVDLAGGSSRRKFAWCSTQTGRCLFVNRRGAPCADITLRGLARLIAAGQARMIDNDSVWLLDRAWAGLCAMLQDFSEQRPTARYEQRPRRLPLSNPQMTQPEKTRTLLLVDDEVNILRSLTRVLRNDGYRILAATGEQEAVRLLNENKVDVIISDQRMPGTVGTEFLRRVQAAHPGIVRILLSGFSDAIAVMEAINRGAVYKFLTKPWNDENIREHVRDAFEACQA